MYPAAGLLYVLSVLQFPPRVKNNVHIGLTPVIHPEHNPASFIALTAQFHFFTHFNTTGEKAVNVCCERADMYAAHTMLLLSAKIYCTHF